jgi:hypothetical protein
LLSQGHPAAYNYTVGRLWLENEITADRINRQAVTQAILFQAAAASVMSKEGGKHFKKLTQDLTDG